MNRWTVAWAAWLAAGLVLEGLAIRRSAWTTEVDTLSDHVWLLRQSPVGRAVFFAGWAGAVTWATVHLFNHEVPA